MRRVRRRSLATTCRAPFGCGSTHATTLLYPLRRASVTEYDRFEYGGLPDRLRSVLCRSRFDYLAITDEFLGRLYVWRAGLAEGRPQRSSRSTPKQLTALRSSMSSQVCHLHYQPAELGDDAGRSPIPDTADPGRVPGKRKLKAQRERTSSLRPTAE
jgi:hypothetical protein